MKLSLSKFVKSIACCSLAFSSLAFTHQANAYQEPAQFYSSVSKALTEGNINIAPPSIEQVYSFESKKDVPGTPFTKTSMILLPQALSSIYYVGKRSGDVYGVITTANLDYNNIVKPPLKRLAQEDLFQYAVISAAQLNAKDTYKEVYPQVANLFKQSFQAYVKGGFQKPVKQEININGYRYQVVFSNYNKVRLLQVSAFRTIFNYGQKDINFKNKK